MYELKCKSEALEMAKQFLQERENSVWIIKEIEKLEGSEG